MVGLGSWYNLQRRSNMLFFIDLDLIQDVKEEFEIGAIIDLTKDGEDILKNASRIYNVLEQHPNVNALIIKTWYSQIAANILKDFESKSAAAVFFQFVDEEENKEEIYALQSNRVLGNVPCSDETQIMHYIRWGIRNIQIAPPICNDFRKMKIIETRGVQFFLAANENRFADRIDSQWIRPEGVRLIEPVCRAFILKGRSSNINTIVSAYIRGQSIDALPNLIYNLYIPNEVNLLPEEFDIRRLRCRGGCACCDACERFIKTYHKLLELRKEEDYEQV